MQIIAKGDIAPSFGTEQLFVITNFVQLRKLELCYTGVSANATNVFANLPYLTDVLFRTARETPPIH